jgi:uncharacterized membrane protein YebE (DUF533 family)
MNTRNLLEQLLQSGSGYLGKPSEPEEQSDMGKMWGFNMPSGDASRSQGGSNDPLSGFLSGAAGGALAASAMSLLLGSKKARKATGNLAMYGGIAALGVAAYKAYNNWQATQTGLPKSQPQTVDRLSGAQAEEHSQAILRALIGAAKADGHIDERERALIDGEIAKLGGDPELARWFQQELGKPLDPAEVAGASRSPEMAAEMYIASALIVDEESYMERAYLQELARQLQLAPALVTELERQARPGAPRA